MLIDVVDPITEAKVEVAERDDIHRDGRWHVAVQANIIRENRGKLEILVQKRSGEVDIAKNCFDQSMAVQMIHGEKFPEESLVRGLYEELGLKVGDYDYVQFNKKGKLRIKKKYEYDSKLENNEILKLYLVNIMKEPSINSPKVNSIFWLPWNDFVSLTKSPYSTKTVRMYTWEDGIKNHLEMAMFNFLKEGKIDDIDINVELVTNISTKFIYD